PLALSELSLQYPFVEWGILLSKKRKGTPRFPSTEWLDDLAQCFYSYTYFEKMNFAIHVCGSYVRQIIEQGSDQFAQDLGNDLFTIFKRVQINTHGEKYGWNEQAVRQLLNDYPEHEFIFQLDGNGENETIAKLIALETPNASVLHDKSH